MAHRLFEEKYHASIYQKYRIIPPDSVTRIILEYLNKKKGPPHELAVDLGCGTGQNTRLLAPHFQKVVGIDVSECQLEEARAVPGFANITYRLGPAEELPFPDGSVDLLTAASAAHWFDAERFLKEAARVLKPHGCIALLGYTDEFSLYYGSCGDKLNNICAEISLCTGMKGSKPVPAGQCPVHKTGSMKTWFSKIGLEELECPAQYPDLNPTEHLRAELKPHGCIALLGYSDEYNLHYGSCGDKLNNVFAEVKKVIKPYASPQLAVAKSRLQALLDAIPFPDKERIEKIPLKMEMTVAGFVGLVESYSFCQIYFKKDPQAAAALLESMRTRLLEEMGVSSPDTKLEFTTDFYCVLACKPQ